MSNPPYMERIRSHSMERGHGRTARRRAADGSNGLMDGAALKAVWSDGGRCDFMDNDMIGYGRLRGGCLECGYNRHLRGMGDSPTAPVLRGPA